MVYLDGHRVEQHRPDGEWLGTAPNLEESTGGNYPRSQGSAANNMGVMNQALRSMQRTIIEILEVHWREDRERI